MNKANFIRALTEVTGQRREAEKLFNRFVLEMRQAIRKGDKVILSGLGSFYPKIRKAQKRRHPKTRKILILPPKRTVRFVPSEALFS